MATRHHLAGLLTAALWAATLGCTPTQPEVPASSAAPVRAPTVVAVSYPLADFATRLAPKDVEVVLPTPRGVDPAFWKPSADEIAEIQRAQLILRNGAGYARWTEYATLPSSRTVVTAAGCRERFLSTGKTRKHRHGPEGEHAHADTASTTWLDMRLARCQAERVRDALIALAPSESDAIEERFEALAADLDDLDARLRTSAAAWKETRKDRGLLASHPVYQYLGDAYGLSIRSLHWEPDQRLDPEALRELDALLQAERSVLMLWEARPTPETEAALAQRGVIALVFDTVSQPPAEGDFVSAMRANAGRLACVMEPETCR